MLEKFTYINNLGEKIYFGKDYLFVNENDLRDFAWEISTKNNKISGFKKGIVSKTIPIIINCGSEDKGIKIRNELFEVFEKDVLAKKHGRIQIGDYYLQCYITGSKKSQYLVHKSLMVVSLIVQTDLTEWVKETTTTATMNSEGVSRYLDYPHDFSHDYKNQLISATVRNNNLAESNFIMTIFGEVMNPTFFIGQHKYAVNVTVGVDEKLVIDSKNKTIKLIDANDKQFNCFNNRDKGSYVFEKIPTGDNKITSTNPHFHFSLTLLEERSEPKWT